MSSAARWIAGSLGLFVGAPLVVTAVAYARAAAHKRRARSACPFENDEHATLPLLRAIQLVAAESLLWCWAIATAPRPPAESAPGPRHGVPVVVLAPLAAPRSSVRLLVARLRADGFRAVCPRLRSLGRTRPQRVHALDDALRAAWEQTGARLVDVIAPAGAAAVVAAHLAAGGSGTPGVRRLLTVGASGGDGLRIPPPTEVIAFYSYDDPFLGRLDAARRPGAVNIAIRAVGRLGLLHAPYVYALLREHLLAPPAAPQSSWTSAAS